MYKRKLVAIYIYRDQ